MTGQINERLVDQHYGRSDLTTAILTGLQAAGKNLDTLTPDDLAPVDQLHVRGKSATLELAQRAGLKDGMQVLDVGGGMGGAARILASEFKCRVTVLDLTEAYIHTGELLTKQTGLSQLVTFQRGSALDMPFPDRHFDVVWTQHSSMNIADKKWLYAEIWRVLRPGGRLALYEIMAGKGGPVYFPVPWAREPSISDIRSPEEIRSLLETIGFRVIEWVDTTALAETWFRQRIVATPASLPPVGIHLVLGKDAPAMFKNQLRNLTDQRIAIIQAVAERPNMH